MIHVTRMGGQPICLNCDLIEEIHCVPDTTLLMTTGRRVIVKESADEVVRRIVVFRQQLAAAPARCATPAPHDQHDQSITPDGHDACRHDAHTLHHDL
jgi:flagellar protein FlbD